VIDDEKIHQRKSDEHNSIEGEDDVEHIVDNSIPNIKISFEKI
jgi:hypothetical protein